MMPTLGVCRQGRAGGAHKAVFLDKDGTLIDDLPWNVDPALITLAPGAGAALRLLRRHDYRLIVISNQPGVALGLFPESALAPVFQRLQALLNPYDVSLDGFYYCPHAPVGALPLDTSPCSCRKPLPGMLLQAASAHDIALAASWMIGDILHDVEAGHRAGCRSLLIDNGNETEWDLSGLRQPQGRMPDLLAAARFIVGDALPEAAGGVRTARKDAPVTENAPSV